MNITTTATIITLAGISSAAAQLPPALEPPPPGYTTYQHKPQYAVIRRMEQLTGQPATTVLPLNRPDATQIALPYQPAVPAPTPLKRFIRADYGGVIIAYQRKYQAALDAGDLYEITGPCESACTLVMQIPRERICFGAQSHLAFHMARDAPNGNPSLLWSNYMVEKYPADIQNWIYAKGGLKMLPTFGAWRLPADELWQMGYRRCD